MALVHIAFSLFLALTASAFSNSLPLTTDRRGFSIQQVNADKILGVALQANTLESIPSPHFIFPGGGIYFYWQAGAVTFLRERGYDLETATMTGASAGALTATLTATNVDFYKATELALKLAADAGVWDRSGGLQGIWGPLIYEWLDELLPHDAVERVNYNARLNLLLTPVPSFGSEKVSVFQDRQDLIRGNIASVHLPWFLDSKLTASFRGNHYIDGSFMTSKESYRHVGGDYAPRNQANTLVFDYNEDPLYQSQRLLSFVEAVSPDGIYQLLEDGKRFAAVMEERGMFSILNKKTDTSKQ